jgi:hypothetical protein
MIYRCILYGLVIFWVSIFVAKSTTFFRSKLKKGACVQILHREHKPLYNCMCHKLQVCSNRIVSLIPLDESNHSIIHTSNKIKKSKICLQQKHVQDAVKYHASRFRANPHTYELFPFFFNSSKISVPSSFFFLVKKRPHNTLLLMNKPVPYGVGENALLMRKL